MNTCMTYRTPSRKIHVHYGNPKKVQRKRGIKLKLVNDEKLKTLPLKLRKKDKNTHFYLTVIQA